MVRYGTPFDTIEIHQKRIRLVGYAKTTGEEMNCTRQP